MSDRAMRVALVAIREIADDPRVLTIVQEALGGRDVKPENGRPTPLSPAEKTRAWRARKAAAVTATVTPPGHAVTADVTDVTEPVTVTVTESVTALRARTQGSHSLEIPEERESETRACARPVTEAVTAPVTETVTKSVTSTVTLPAVRSLELTEPLPDELRETARFPGCEVQDVEGAWRKFLGHYAGQVIPVAGWWQKWCTNESRRERTQRDKRQRDEEAAAPKLDGPAVREERKRREQERRAAEKNAAPPPAAAYALAGIRKAGSG